MMFARALSRRLPVAAAGLFALFAAGCETYHYYDIDVRFGSITKEQASKLQRCDLVVSGAASETATLPEGNGADGKSVCPIVNNWPDLGTFEFATFADSGKITFTITGYGGFPEMDSNLCTSGTLSLTADAQVTQTGTITLGNFNDTNCPQSTTTSSP